jgi:acetylornithine/N-succinyldiaminopimelate aminotransferase
VQSGIGRTGKWFAFQHSGVMPDVMSLAKGLGNGVPIGACVASGVAATLFKPGSHGSTFGGNPLACRAALTVLSVIEKDGLMENATRSGEAIRSGLRRALAGCTGVKDIRGEGLMIGIELSAPCGELVQAALEKGMLINVTADSVVRLVPPLIYTAEHVKTLVDGLAPLIRDFAERQPSTATAP